MFDRREAFTHLNGKRMALEDFLSALGLIRLCYLRHLAPEVGQIELYEMALQEGWLIEERGFVTVKMDPQPCSHPSTFDSMPAHCAVCGEELP